MAGGPRDAADTFQRGRDPSCHCRCASCCATGQSVPAEPPWPGLSQQRRRGHTGLAEPLSCQAGSLPEYQVLSCAAGCAASRAERQEAPEPQRWAGRAGHHQDAALVPVCSPVIPQERAGSGPGLCAPGGSGAWGYNAWQRDAPCTWARTPSQRICPSTASDISKAGGHWHHPAFRSSICDSTPRLVCQGRSSPCKPLLQESCIGQARNQRRLCRGCHMEPGWL